MNFEEIKQYFSQLTPEYFEKINCNDSHDLKSFCEIAIDDLNQKLNNKNTEATLKQGDIEYASLFTFHLIYDLVADKIPEIDKFAEAWASLYSNYLNAFYPMYNNAYIEGLINLLSLKNNMARLIMLSDYIIFKKQNDTYNNVSNTFIQSIINNRKAEENDKEKK